MVSKAAMKGEKKTNVQKLIADFQRDNRELLEAMRLFEVSNTEYERAMEALTSAPSITAASTRLAVDRDASLLE